MRYILILITLFMIISPVNAETMAVKAIEDISTKLPNKIYKVELVRDCSLGDIPLQKGYIIEGKMISVTDPKRLKKDATFTYGPLNYYDLSGEKHHFSKLYIGEYTPKFEINVAKAAKSAALMAGNRVIKGMSSGFYAVEGAVKNNEGNRIKSAAENVYENSPLSYIEKGEQLQIEKETCFGLKFDECINNKNNY